MRRAPHRLGVLLSGRGSNFIAIDDAIGSGTLRGCEIVVVLSNVDSAPGLEVARARGYTAVAEVSKGISREAHDARMLSALHNHAVDYVILAGYMRVLTPDFIRAFPNRILNIHPSLLPAFPGLHAQRQALDYGAKVAGCTVHFVDEAVDGGVIILQRLVRVHENDTEESLSARILQQEHRAYPQAIARVLSGRYEVRDRRYVARPTGTLVNQVSRQDTYPL